MKIEKSSVSIKVEGKEKPVEFSYDKKTAESIDDAKSLVAEFFDKVREGKETAESAILAAFNYGFDLKVKASVRQRGLATLEGPTKAFDNVRKNLIAALMASGLPEEAATAMADSQVENMKKLVPTS